MNLICHLFEIVEVWMIVKRKQKERGYLVIREDVKSLAPRSITTKKENFLEKNLKVKGATAFSPLPYRISSIVRQFIQDSYSTGNCSRKYGTGCVFIILYYNEKK